MDYELQPDQFRDALAQMAGYRTDAASYVTFAVVQALLRLRMTSPLGWVIRHQAAMRALLGLR